MLVDVAELSDFLARWYWSVVRLGGFMMVMPIFGNRLIPTRVRIGMLLACATLVATVLPEAPAPFEFNMSIVITTAQQLLSGIALGFSAVLFFQIFVIAGQFIGMQMGLGFAALVDPGNGLNVTVWSQFFLMLVTLAFLSVDGHLVMLQVMIEGFISHPVGLQIAPKTVVADLVESASWMFASGLRVALPAVMAQLIVNISFGVMNKAAPALNVFSLGFPFGLLFGLVIIGLIVQGFDSLFQELVREYFERLR